MKKIVPSILVICMMVSLLTGCGKSDDNKGNNDAAKTPGSSSDNDNASGSKYQTTYGSKMFDDVTITVELYDRSNAPEGSTISNNRWEKYVNEQMNKVGINVKFISVPRSDEISKMQTMMASQTAPDLTLTYTYSHAQGYFKDGGTWDLTEFIAGEDQAQNLKTYLGQDVLDIGRMSTGEYYGIVAKRATTAQSNLFIRKDWLDDLNLAIPTTPDELFDAIYQIKNNHPKGLNNIIGMTFFGLNDTTNSVAYRNQLEMAFSQLTHDPKELDIAHGFDYYYDPGAREYYKFANKCYNAGLLDQEYYTMTFDNFNGDIVNSKQAFFEMNVNYNVDPLRGSLMHTLLENDPTAELVSIPPLYNVVDGKQYSPTFAKGGLIAFCTKTASAEVVEACMTYLDWMATEEGGFVLHHGFEGEHFVYDENKVPIVKDPEYNKVDKDWIRTDIFLVGNQGYFATIEDFNACVAAEVPGFEQYVIDNYENAMVGTLVPATSYTSPSTPDIRIDLSLLCSEYLVQAITGPESEFDKTYDKFMQECEKAGIKTIIEERTEYYTELYGY